MQQRPLNKIRVIKAIMRTRKKTFEVFHSNIVNPDQTTCFTRKTPRSRTVRNVLWPIDTFRTTQLHKAPRSQTIGKVLCPASYSFFELSGFAELSEPFSFAQWKTHVQPFHKCVTRPGFEIKKYCEPRSNYTLVKRLGIMENLGMCFSLSRFSWTSISCESE